MKKRDLLVYIANLEARVITLNRRVNILEAQVGYLPTPPNGNRMGIHTDCGCPANHICNNVACPRMMQVTCQGVS